MTGMFEVLERLSTLKSTAVVSLYLKLDPEVRQDRKYLIIYKDMVKRKKEELKKRGTEEKLIKSVDESFKRIEEFLSEPDNLKNCRGIGIFSSYEEGIFEYIKLPYVYRNRLLIGDHPMIREIAAIDEELGRVGILLVDRKHARFFRMDINGIEEIVNFLEPLSTRSHKFHSGGSALKGAEGTFKMQMPSRVAGPNLIQHSFGEWRFHMRIKNEWQGLLKLSADAIFEDWKESKFDKLIVGGIDAGKVREIENHLHPYLRERLIGYIEANPSTATPNEIREKAINLLIEKDREEEKDLIKELQELEGKGLAVNGTSRVLEMLSMGNVRTVLIPEDFEKEGYICSETKVITLKPECPSEEKALYSSDIVEEVIEEALSQKAVVEVIETPELQKKVDGMAAFLRFKI